MSIRRTALVAFLTVAAFVQIFAVPPRAQAQGAAKPAPERVATDTPRATAGGATFTVPSGWSISADKNLVVLEAPETDTHIAILHSQRTDAPAPPAAAWPAHKP